MVKTITKEGFGIRCNHYTKSGLQCEQLLGHEGAHSFIYAVKAVMEAVTFQMQHGEASDFIDADTPEFADEFPDGTVGAEECAARRDLQWCRKQLAEVLKLL